MKNTIMPIGFWHDFTPTGLWLGSVLARRKYKEFLETAPIPETRALISELNAYVKERDGASLVDSSKTEYQFDWTAVKLHHNRS